MTKKYIQIKDNAFGEAFNTRSYLVSSETVDSYGIRKDTIFVPKECAIDLDTQTLNLEMETVFASPCLNVKAITKQGLIPFEKAQTDKLKVVNHCIENGILYLCFGDDFDDDDNEYWYKARYFVLNRTPLQYDFDFYANKFELFQKQVEGLFKQEFIEGLTKDLFIMKDQFKGQDAGYSLRSGDFFVSSFAQFKTVEELKQSLMFDLAIKGEL